MSEVATAAQSNIVRQDRKPPLELATFEVRDVVFGAQTRLAEGVLTINADELKALLMESGDFRDVGIDIVKPGDDVRIVHIIDLVEPRVRVSEPDTDFPGLLSPPRTVGSGRTNRLSGMTVLEVAEPVPGEPTYWREAILDMGGEGAQYSPFSQLIHVVVDFKPKLERFPVASLDNIFEGSQGAVEFNRAVRLAGLRAAVYLAGAASQAKADRVQKYSLSRTGNGLPTVVYMFQAGLPYIYGEVAPGGGAVGGPAQLPTLIHPSEVLDGALVNSFTVIACMRETTNLLQNHPVIQELYARHGVDLHFAGVVMYTFGDSTDTKERITSYAANLASLLGANGAVLNYLGGGHPAVDFMMTCQKLEQQGIKTSLLSPEMAVNPDDSGFVHFVREADAIVSTGNYEQMVKLPKVSRVIGGSTILETGDAAAGTLEMSLRVIVGSTNQFGMFSLRGRQH